MKVELSPAEIGLLHALLIKDVTENPDNPQSYEVIVTGEVTDTGKLFVKFTDLVLQAGREPFTTPDRAPEQTEEQND